METCIVDGCTNKVIAKKLCNKHYRRNLNHGNVHTLLRVDGDTKKSFFSKIEPIPECGCWIWTGSTSSWGYGKIGIAGKTIATHRYSWELHNGSIPIGISVLHKCDTPACVNPNHLFLGTQQDNMADASRKGRLPGRPR